MKFDYIKHALLTFLLCSQSGAVAAESVREEGLSCVRLQDETTLHIGRSYLAFTEVIVVGAIIRDENRRTGVRNMAHFYLSPLLLRADSGNRIAIPSLKPQFGVSHGKILRFAFVDRHANEANFAANMTGDGAYVVDIEFDNNPPEKFVLTLQMAASVKLQAGTQMLYTPSDDALSFDWAHRDGSRFSLRVSTDPALGDWIVERDGVAILPQGESWVTLEKRKSYTIRIGASRKGS